MAHRFQVGHSYFALALPIGVEGSALVLVIVLAMVLVVLLAALVKAFALVVWLMLALAEMVVLALLWNNQTAVK